MTISRRVHLQLVIALLVVTAIVLAMSSATANRIGPGELINRPDMPPSRCWIDKRHGWFTECDHSRG